MGIWILNHRFSIFPSENGECGSGDDLFNVSLSRATTPAAPTQLGRWWATPKSAPTPSWLTRSPASKSSPATSSAWTKSTWPTKVIRCLLIEKFPESSLNEQAGKMLLENYEEYAKHARLHNGIHALKLKPKLKSGAISESTAALNVEQTNSSAKCGDQKNAIPGCAPQLPSPLAPKPENGQDHPAAMASSGLQNIGEHCEKAGCRRSVICCNMCSSCCGTWVVGTVKGVEGNLLPIFHGAIVDLCIFC